MIFALDPDFFSNLLLPGVTVLEKVVRAVAVYAFLIIGLRLAGKRELAQLNPFDLVVLLTISNTVQNAIIGADNSVVGGVIGATTLLVVNYLVIRFLYRHEKVDRWLEGSPDVLVEDGKIRHDRLEKELITIAELEAAAHRQGFASLEHVDKVILEPGGTLSFIAKEPTPETTRHDELMAAVAKVTQELQSLRAAIGKK